MERLVKQLINGRKVVFDDGRFDQWCVYLVESSGTRTAPHDVTYFSALMKIAKNYAAGKVYADFVSIFKSTNATIDNNVLELIDSISATYRPGHQTSIEQWFTVIYAGMIAEENKENAILKKRVKHLGMYQVLNLGMPPADAARFSTGKNWRLLDTLMKSYGF